MLLLCNIRLKYAANIIKASRHGFHDIRPWDKFASGLGDCMRQRFRLLASSALTTTATILSGAASAAPPALASWNGCYAGLNGGGAWGRIDQTVTIPAPVNFAFSDSGRDSGFIGGGQVGCNWHHQRNWVFGVEGDFNYVNLSRTQSFSRNNVFGGEDVVGNQATKLHWLATLRGRFGPSWDRTFLYGTAGLAIGRVTSSVDALQTSGPDNPFAGSYSAIRFGWTAGLGVEHAFNGRVSAKLEYLHFDLGTASYNVNLISGTTSLPSTWNASAKVSGDIVRVGINVKLTSP